MLRKRVRAFVSKSKHAYVHNLVTKLNAHFRDQQHKKAFWRTLQWRILVKGSARCSHRLAALRDSNGAHFTGPIHGFNRWKCGTKAY